VAGTRPKKRGQGRGESTKEEKVRAIFLRERKKTASRQTEGGRGRREKKKRFENSERRNPERRGSCQLARKTACTGRRLSLRQERRPV